MTQSARRPATIEDFYRIPDAERFHELIEGVIVEKAAPSGEHAGAQSSLVIAIGGPYQRAPGRGGPGGWWFLTEVDVQLDADIVRPDVCGWRRDRCAERPTGMPVKLRPDWIGEILSTSNAANDLVKKMRLYQRVGIPHYWIVDPMATTLTVMRWSEAGYITVLSAERGETVRAEPFADIDLVVGTLFGDDPP